MGKTCPNCGFEIIDDEDVFCAECGTNLNLSNLESNNFSQEISRIKQDGKIHLTNELIQNYFDITTDLNKFENLENEVSHQEDYFNQLREERERLQKEIQNLKIKTNREHKDVEKLEKLTWTSIKARFKGDKNARLEKEEYEYLQALNEEQNAIDQLETVNRKYTNALEQLNNLKKLMKQKKQLKAHLKQILNIACEGVPDPIEDQIELELHRLQDQRIPITQRKSQIQAGIGHFKVTQHYLQNALNQLEGARGMANWDTFFGGGLIVDSMKRSDITHAQREVQNARISLRSAYKVVPNAPTVTIPTIWKGSGVWDMFFDGFFADMHVRDKIIQSINQTEHTFHEIQQAISHLNNQISSLDIQLTNLGQKITEVQEKLMNERKRMFEEALY